MNLTIAQVVEYSKANILTEACDTTLMVSDICWDTRAMADVTNVFANDEALRKPETAKDPETANVPTGVLFIAFKGERTDGNDYIIEAISKGAVVVLAGRDLNAEEYALAKQRGTCVLRSDDTVASLQQLAASYRKLLESNTHFTTIGITGSSGKTTTKDLVAAVLKTTYATVATQGNHNNEIGLPITILSAKMADDNVSESTQMLVTEMGMQGLGEISLLANIAKPKIGVLTNIGVAHCELLGSRENIARAKSELILALPDHSGIAILNGDDAFEPFVREVAQTAERDIKVVLYGLGSHNDIRATNISYDEQGRASFDLWLRDGRPRRAFLALAGEHNILNALAASACGVACGIDPDDILRALSQAQATSMRQETVQAANGVTVINDTYNANPDSMRAALSMLAQMNCVDSINKHERLHIAVLGDMYELGVEEVIFHREVGAFAHLNGLDILVTVGKLGAEIAKGALDAGMEKNSVHAFSDIAGAITLLENYLNEQPVILVKASRGMHLETLVEGVLSRC